MTSWFAAIPEIAFMVAILGLPGLLVARCLRFGWWDAVALSAPLSLGVLALANLASMATGISWGLPVVVGATLVVAIAALVCVRIPAFSSEPSLGFAGGGLSEVDGIAWSRRAQIIAMVATFAAVIIGAIVIARGTGTPHTLNQTHDGAFHINSIAAIAHDHRAAPSVLNNLGYKFGVGGFYPPTFAAIGALIVMYTGVSPVLAANVASVAIAMMWPLAVSIAIRRLARPAAFGYVVGMVGAVTVSLFPAVLFAWGTVWPNALSVLALPAALVLIVRLFGLDRARDGAVDPHGPLGPWWICFIAGVIMLPGMMFAQPQAIFALFFLSLPILARMMWRRLIGPEPDQRRRLLVAGFIAAVIVGLLAVVDWIAFGQPAFSAVGNFENDRVSWWWALLQVFTLSARQGYPNIAFAVLTLIGIYVGLRTSRGRYLVAAYGVLALLCFLASAVQTHLTNYLTGYWYNAAPRIFAILPVVGLPLAAMAADVVRARVQRLIKQRSRVDSFTWGSRRLSVSTASGLVVCLGILVLQAGLGTARVSQVVSENNTCRGSACVVPPGAQALLEKVARTMKPGQTIAGNPYTGEILAAQFTGHDVVYPTWARSLDPTAAYLALHFRDYREDHLACAALKALNVGVILTGRKFHSETPHDHAPFVGFDLPADPASLGLTKIASGGQLTAYRVGSCNSYLYPQGRLITPGQEALFTQLASAAPAGLSVAGNPYTGAIFAGILSHRVGIFQKLAPPTDLASALVGARFSSYQSDWLVCAAVKSLKIGAVVDGQTYRGETAADHVPYAGFDHLDAMTGLTVMHDRSGNSLSSGGATAYSVGNCGAS